MLRTLKDTVRGHSSPIRQEQYYYRLVEVEHYVDLGLLSLQVGQLDVNSQSPECAANISLSRKKRWTDALKDSLTTSAVYRLSPILLVSGGASAHNHSEYARPLSAIRRPTSPG